MAEGGSFTVPGGSGGSDSVDVAIKATPGEKIFVLPPDQAKRWGQRRNAITPTLRPLEDDHGPVGAIPGNDNDGGRNWGGGWAGVPMRQSPVKTDSDLKNGGQPINIIVQDKVTADDFIRSRAQIGRVFQ
jgi:hypothetical protein